MPRTAISSVPVIISRRGLLLCIACITACALIAGAQEPARPLVPVTDAMLQTPDPANWLSWRRTLDGWGYSPLAQITRANVGQLRLVWSRGMGAGRNEATPLVYDGVMYLPNPSDVIQAIDAASGDLLWEYRRTLPEDTRRANESNRSLAIYGDAIIDTSSDNQVYALDARTGRLRWETAVFDHTRAATATGGPIIANGKIISGRNCLVDASPDGCFISAHDARTGRELWRTYTIARPGEPGGDSWGDLAWEQRWHVGTWMTPSYDPDLNLVFIGTSVTAPAPKFALAGNDKKYLYHNSTLALDADTGKIVWYYQHVVDHWDLDHPFERLLVDTAVTPSAAEVPWINPRLRPGERRRVVTGIPGKTGIVYTLDRQTGEFLWARPTILQNVVSRINGATGDVTVNPEALFTQVGQERFICPSSNGGKNWPTGAYNPTTNTMYMPMQNTCMNVTPTTASPDPRQLYGFRSGVVMTPGATGVGSVWAISAETGRTVWKYEQRAGVLPLLSTAGGLVFMGDAAGRVKALDDRSGRVLWEVNVGSAANGFPITYSVGGRQYLAVSTGVSNVSTGTARQAGITTGSNNQIFVFALP